jgi:DNA-binding CsgD family transcriptional regulator
MFQELIDHAAAGPWTINDRSFGPIIRTLEALNCIEAGLSDTQGVFRWSTTCLALHLGVTPGDEIQLARHGTPEWHRERVLAAREIVDTHSPRKFLEIFNGRFVETLGIPVDFSESEPLALIILIPKLTSMPSCTGPQIPTRVLTEGHWGPLGILTRRQLDVLRLITIGKSNPEIASDLGRTRRAIEWHVHELLRILGARDRIALHRLGRDAGFGEIDDNLWNQFLSAHRARRPQTEDFDSPPGSRPPALSESKPHTVTRASARGSSQE